MSKDILYSNTITTLKKICKFLHIKNYSSLKKEELILTINKYHSVLKIQKWIRKIFCKNEPCPISCEKIKYPCYPFKSGNVLIYYNLESLRSYLINTGDFRDPNTRIKYTDQQLLQMDEIYKNSKNKESEKESEKDLNKQYFKSVYKASKNTKFYEKLKEKEQEELIFERILDMLCDEMSMYISENNDCNIFRLNAVYLYEYESHFKRLIFRSKKHANYVINKNIDSFNQLYIKEKNYTDNQKKVCEYVILFMYQLREEVVN